MSTLKELMGDLTRGDGRKFVLTTGPDQPFEPVFLVKGVWFGLFQNGAAGFDEKAYDNWSEEKTVEVDDE